MKIFILSFLLFFISLGAFAQEVDFSGVYTHEFEGEISYLEVIQQDGQISAELHDYRGIYYLHGTLEDDKAKGLINLGNSAQFFELNILGDYVQLLIIDMTEYGEPNYATQYDLMFLPDSTAERPKKTLHNPFEPNSSSKNEADYISAGRISAPYLGLQFNIPKDFKAENNYSDIILIPNSGFGFIMIFRHDFEEMDKLKPFLEKGYSDKEMSLVVSNIENKSDSLISFDAKGFYQGIKVQVEGLSNIGPSGHGVIMFFVMKEEEYLSAANSELELIMNTMSFFPITQHPLAERWTYDLKGKSLKYGKGSNSEVVSSEMLKTTAWINLCPNMSFKMVEPGKGGKPEVIEGNWNVEVLYGIPHLNLYSSNNDFQTYTLFHENGRLLMNKERWIVLKGFDSECQEKE